MLKIHNTLSREKEEFQPLSQKEVTFYQCGPTVYWTQHIGNMRAMVLADLIRRSMEYLGYKIKMARNYTDVGHMVSDEDEGEDKMEKGAKREGLTPEEIAEKYIKIFENDISELNVEPLLAENKPRATEYVQEIGGMVQELIDKGYAYATDLAIYFDVSQAKDYTKLSGQKLEMNQTDAGKGEVSDSKKKNPIDFAVWYFKVGAHEKALQTWPFKFKNIEQPTEAGFPGWHAECSAMSRKLLGRTLDLHMGGIEHVPVHHTNEIAQSEAANGVKFVNYWLHNEHLTVDGGKMSKSQGTAYALAEVKEKGFDPLALRYFFLQAHYRSKQNFTWESLEAANSALQGIYEKFLAWENSGGAVNEIYKEKFIAGLEDDFNLPQALSVVWEILKSDLPEADKRATLLDFDRVLGLNLAGLKQAEIPAEVLALADERLAARKNKDFAKSDELRAEIQKLGFEVEDEKGGYKLKIKN